MFRGKKKIMDSGITACTANYVNSTHLESFIALLKFGKKIIIKKNQRHASQAETHYNLIKARWYTR